MSTDRAPEPELPAAIREAIEREMPNFTDPECWGLDQPECQFIRESLQHIARLALSYGQQEAQGLPNVACKCGYLMLSLADGGRMLTFICNKCGNSVQVERPAAPPKDEA